MKTDRHDYPFVIIGGGLAGTTLAWQLLKRGGKFLMLDIDAPKATERATGIYNPIVFKRLTKSWNVDACLPVALKFYNEIESKLTMDIVHEKPVVRKLKTAQAQNEWNTKAGQPSFQRYLEPTDDIEGKVKQAGHVNLPAYIHGSHELFLKDTVLKRIREKPTVHIDNGAVVLQSGDFNLRAGQVVFCEGPYATENPYFNYLPFELTKGETLTVKSDGLNLQHILKERFFVLPLGNDFYKIGASYDWDNVDWIPTKEGRWELYTHLKKMIHRSVKVMAHQAGVRPTVKDRRPLLGTHPKHKNLHIFNGLGSKGVMLAPYYAGQLCDYLMAQKPLDESVDISRFETL